MLEAVPTTLLSQATWFTERGISILPLVGKTGDVKKAKPSTELIKGNYGIALGGGLIGIDYDEHDGATGIEAFTDTRAWKSGSGQGYGILYFVPNELSTHTYVISKGITVRGKNSYLVGPGSIHPGTPKKGIKPGGIYTLLEQADIEIAEAPEWLLGLLQARATAAIETKLELKESTRPDWLFNDSSWVKKFETTDNCDRSAQTWNISSYSGERGASNEELSWIISHFPPAIDKDYLSAEVPRVIQKVRSKHQHSGRPCDAAGVDCPNKPEWMSKQLASIDFWDSSPLLKYIYEESRCRRVPPKAVLLSVLTHICASIPIEFVLPAIIGAQASINFFAAFVGESGDGKGSSTRVASSLFNYSQTGFTYHVGKGGSGEGLVGIYAYYDHMKKVVVHKTASAFLNINEIDDLAATGSRSGSTMLSTLREAWFAEPLGHDYVKNPTQLPELSYRLALQVAAQPLRSKWLLDDIDGGLTQRIVFVSTSDPECVHPDVVLESPTPIAWVVPVEILELSQSKKSKIEEDKKTSELMKSLSLIEEEKSQFIEIKVCELAKRTILLEHWKRKTSPKEAIDSHFLLAQEKVALLLAALHGKLEVDEENWKRAAIVMSWSKRAIDNIKTEIQKKTQIDQMARTTAAGDKQEYLDKRAENKAVTDTATNILKWAKNGLVKMSGRDGIKMKIKNDKRQFIDDAIEWLINEKKIEYNEETTEIKLS